MIETYLAKFGYLALGFGTFLEGETILIVAGFLAQQGYLRLDWVIFSAFAGSFLGDQLYFHIGRRYGSSLLHKRPRWQKRAHRVHALLQKYHSALILAFRFIYGIRTVTPFFLGTSSVSTTLYFVLNLISAVAWSIVIALGGYLFGKVSTLVIDQIKYFEIVVIVFIVVAGTAFWMFTRWRENKMGNS